MALPLIFRWTFAMEHRFHRGTARPMQIGFHEAAGKERTLATGDILDECPCSADRLVRALHSGQFVRRLPTKRYQTP